MQILFGVLVALLGLITVRATLPSVAERQAGPQFVEGGFSVILQNNLDAEEVENVMEQIRQMHESSAHVTWTGVVSKRFTKAFKVG